MMEGTSFFRQTARGRGHVGADRPAARLRRRVATVAITALLSLLPAIVPLAHAAERVALVVGNGEYTDIGHLPNPPNDAEDMSAALDRLGFDVTTVLHADLARMKDALRMFARRSREAEVALVFYAGHGMEMDGVNYLVPVDARLELDTDVALETMRLEQVLDATQGAALRVVILDACRNNPLARRVRRTSATRSVSRGSLGELDEALLGDETLVAYSAAAGTLAEDGTGRNSPYTAALLDYLDGPHEILSLFRRVRGQVLQETGRRQRPHEYQSLLSEHYLSSVRNPAAQDLYDAGASPGAGSGAGLKYTILRQGRGGEGVPVDPGTTVFRAGERIRFVFETNGGYLYIILDGSSGRTHRLYPDPRINSGRNDVAPFVQVQIPQDAWFRFDDTPGTERVRVYLTKETGPRSGRCEQGGCPVGIAGPVGRGRNARRGRCPGSLLRQE